MTREEAIDCLEGLKIYLKTEHIDQEALDMAIEALSAETHEIRTETHGVCLINRQDAIESICDVVINEFDVCPTCGYDVAEKALSALPSVEPVKHGEWIEGELYIKCSECGYPAGHLSDNFCPNCGAKMRGETE